MLRGNYLIWWQGANSVAVSVGLLGNTHEMGLLHSHSRSLQCSLVSQHQHQPQPPHNRADLGSNATFWNLSNTFEHLLRTGLDCQMGRGFALLGTILLVKLCPASIIKPRSFMFTFKYYLNPGLAPTSTAF